MLLPCRIDPLDDAGGMPAANILDARVGDVGRKARPDLLERLLRPAEDGEGRRHAMLLDIAAVQLRDVVTGPGEDLKRSEERRVGKECVSTCRSRWSPYH